MKIEPVVSKRKFMGRVRDINLVLAYGKDEWAMSTGLMFVPMINRGLLSGEYVASFARKQKHNTGYTTTFHSEMYYGGFRSGRYVMQSTLLDTIHFSTLRFGQYYRDKWSGEDSTIYGVFLKPILYTTYMNICQLENTLTTEDKELFTLDCSRYMDIIAKTVGDNSVDLSKFFSEPGNSMETYLINLILFLSCGDTSLLKQWAYWSHHE